MKKFASVIALAVIFGLGNAANASAATPVKNDRKASVTNTVERKASETNRKLVVTPAEKEHTVQEKER